MALPVSRSGHRSLWPRVHGAYAQLMAPLAASLLMRDLAPGAALLAIAAACAFLANEPLLVVRGHRGPRIRATDGDRARRRLVALVVTVSITGGVGLVLARRGTLEIAILAAVPAIALVVLAYRRAQRSVIGEVIAAVSLPGASAPVMVASGVSSRTALVVWAAWSVGFVASVVAVHRVIARNRLPADRIDGVLATMIAVATVATALVSVEVRPSGVGIPLLAASAVLLVRPPAARRLRAIGVTLVIASLVSMGLAIAIA